MKRILLLSAAILAAPALSLRADTAAEKLKEAASEFKQAAKDIGGAVAQKSREAWRQTKAYASDDPVIYRRSASDELDALGREIASLQQAALARAPRYFADRLAALSEQQAACAKQAEVLSIEEIHDLRSPARQQFDTNLSWLETYTSSAEREAEDLGIVAIRR